MKKFISLILSLIVCSIIFTSNAYCDRAQYIPDLIVTSPTGIWTDSRAYATLADAVSAIGAVVEQTLMVAKPLTIASSLVISSNISLEVKKGAIITISAGQTLTINGPFDAGLYQVFTGVGLVVFNQGGIEGVWPEWFGAKADGLPGSAVDNVSAFTRANTAAFSDMVSCGHKRSILLSSGTYYVTSTPGTYALTINGPIVGQGAEVSIIRNSGTGSAISITGVTGEIYYSRWRDFSVIGNATSQDGICLNISGALGTAVAYCNFDRVDSSYHGRNGLVHRYSWATKYTDCKFHHNGGLGVYLYIAEAGHNNIIFRDCDSRWNGGVGDASADYTKGGVRISASDGVYWLGGVVEANNAWGFIIGEDVAGPASMVVIRDVYCEDTPKSIAASATGGFIFCSPNHAGNPKLAYTNVKVTKCTIHFGGGAAGQTGYAFYLAGYYTGAFREWENSLIGGGAGTAIRDVGLNYVAKWMSNSEIITAQGDRDFSGGAHWTNIDFDTFNTTGDLTLVASAASSCFLPVANINNGKGLTYGKKYGIRFDASNVTGNMFIIDGGGTMRLPNIHNATGVVQEFVWISTSADKSLFINSFAAGTADIDNISIYEVDAGDNFIDNDLLSVTTVSFAANADTTLYTVPTGKRCVLTKAIVVAGADAGATTTMSIGQNGATTDFLGNQTLTNLDVQYDSVILQPVPNATPVKGKSYAAATVIEATVANQSGGATNTVYLYGMLY